MIHLRYMAEDGWTGRSPLEVAAESVGLALAGQESAARAATGVTARAVIRLRDDYEDDEARVRSARRVAAALRAPEVEGFRILGEGEDVQTLDMKAADQELLGSRKFDREQIAAIYRVPPAKLAAPSSPDGPADALRCAQDFVACDCTGGVRFTDFGVLPRRDDGGRAAGGDGVMALAGVEGAVGGDGGDVLVGRDLVQQLGQHRRVADIADGELGGPNFQRFLIDSDVDPAPDPPLRAAMLAGIPLASPPPP
jgi:hypothetical protein